MPSQDNLKSKQELKFSRYTRYVDNSLLIFNSDSKLQFLSQGLNCFHPNSKFTHELESAFRLNYLEFWIYRKDKFQTTIYRNRSAIHQQSGDSHISKGNIWKTSFFEPKKFVLIL